MNIRPLEYHSIHNSQASIAAFVSSTSGARFAAGPAEFAGRLAEIERAMLDAPPTAKCVVLPLGEAGRCLWHESHWRVASAVSRRRLEAVVVGEVSELMQLDPTATLGDFLDTCPSDQISVSSLLNPLEVDGEWPLLVPDPQRNPPTLENLIESFSGDEVNDIALRAGLFQIFDALDASHQLAQSIEGEGHPRNGDYWHAIMHRREADYGNSRYWFRAVGNHPIFPKLRTEALRILKSCHDPAARPWLERMQTGNWEPALFVDLCRECSEDETGPLACAVRAIQWFEMLLLINACAKSRNS